MRLKFTALFFKIRPVGRLQRKGLFYCFKGLPKITINKIALCKGIKDMRFRIKLCGLSGKQESF